MEHYEIYQNDKFGLSFEYPKEWKSKFLINNSERDKLDLIIHIISPVNNKTKIGYTTIDLWVTPKESFASFDAYCEDSINKNSIGKPRIISNKKIQFLNREAREISIAFDTYRPPRVPRKQQILVVCIDKWVVIEKDGFFFELLYHSSEDDFPKFVEAYEHAKSTFKFF